MTYDDVEEALVEAVQLQWRTEGGNWPFASDGPWHLIRKEWMDWDARDAKPMPRIPLSKVEAERLREVMGWLTLIPGDYDRRLVVLGVTELAKGNKQGRWRRLSMSGKGDAAPDALKMAYRRALGALTKRLNLRNR